MAKFFLFSLISVCGFAYAQSPANNLMPDGSVDRYVGIGVVSRSVYDGARERRVAWQPVLQMQWSNGAFISGQRLGMHLSTHPHVEFGPLLTGDSSRNDSGAGRSLGALDVSIGSGDALAFKLGTVNSLGTVAGTGGPLTPAGTNPNGIDYGNAVALSSNATVGTVSLAIGQGTIVTIPTADFQNQTMFVDGVTTIKLSSKAPRLTGMNVIDPRLLLGWFYNVSLSDRLRLTSDVLAGSGNARRGVRVRADLQQTLGMLPPHHALAVGIGATWANHAHPQAFFGVTEQESARSLNRVFRPAAGIKDVRLGVRWNWSFNAGWILTSNIEASILTCNAADSPLVERRSNTGVSSALVYRF